MEEYDNETAKSCLQGFMDGSITRLVSSLREKSISKAQKIMNDLDSISGKGDLLVNGEVLSVHKDEKKGVKSGKEYTSYNIKIDDTREYNILVDKSDGFFYELGLKGVKKNIFTYMSTSKNDDDLREIISGGCKALAEKDKAFSNLQSTSVASGSGVQGHSTPRSNPIRPEIPPMRIGEHIIVENTQL